MKENLTNPNLFHYLADLRFKSHVQHAVSFIQHQISATTQISLTTLQEVNETTWGSNANLNTLKKHTQKKTQQHTFKTNQTLIIKHMPNSKEVDYVQ